MKAIPFPQANKVLKAPPGQEQEVYDLPVWGGDVDGIPRCISCWEPSPEERALIAAGGPVWLWVVGTTHPPVALDAAHPFEEQRQSQSSVLPPEEALALAGKLLQRLTDDGRQVSLRAVREEIPLEPEAIFEGAKATCQRHRKGRLFILIQELEDGASAPGPEPESRPDLIAISEAEEAARHFKETWPLPYRPGGEVDEP